MRSTSRRLGRAPVAAGVLAALIASLLPATTAAAQPIDPDPTVTLDEIPQPEVPAARETSATPSGVLISEVANGGPGANSNANRVATDDFIEIANFGDSTVDVSGWRILRCGQTGDGYGPQKVVPAGTVLEPGDTYTTANPAANPVTVPRDDDYDTSASTMHAFGFGAYLEDADYHLVDSVGFYHRNVHSACAADDPITRGLDYRLGESHQRIDTTGDRQQDWTVAPRTPSAPNASGGYDNLAPSPIRISEFTNGGPADYADQFVELTNYGDAPVDITGWKLYRCGENGSAYLQNAALPEGSVVAPGASYLIARAGTAYQGPAPQATYGTSMHWREFGVMLTRADDRIVDRAGVYADRNSICVSGGGISDRLNVIEGESVHRVAETGDDAVDFVVAGNRSPGEASAADDLAPRRAIEPTEIRVSEINGGGPAGGNDEFIELANFGETPVDLTGWALHRCEGDGRVSVTPQVADLATVLQPGETYLAAAAAAPAALRAMADATYAVGLNQTDGYGVYLRNADGDPVEGVSVYESVPYSPCTIGSELRNYAKTDLGESYQRARFTGDNEEDFVQTPDRTPGVLADIAWDDQTTPREGQLDPVAMPRKHVPGTPVATGATSDDTYRVTVTGRDADSEELTAQVHGATAVDLDTDAVRIFAGTTRRAIPARLSVVGERRVATAPALVTRGSGGTYPFQRFEVPTDALDAADGRFVWSGRTTERNEIQLYTWEAEPGAWTLLDAAVPSADGDLTLVGEVAGDADVAHLLVIDGPRTSGGLVEEIGVVDQQFSDPDDYDFAFHHMTDTQFLAEGFRRVFTDMVSWVVANADARKIAYATNTGDIIENWIGGNSDPVRAHKEFAAARRIHRLLNEAGIPNGVLPGNHDNLWGRNNDLYNQYFGPGEFEDQPWWGGAWRPGDNSAHYDFFEAGGHEFLVIALQYRPSAEQRAWAREVAAAYPEHNTILLTHSYLKTDGTRETRDDRFVAYGSDIWAEVIAPSDNIFLVLGGHYHGVATKYGDPVTGEQVDAVAIAGDTVAVRNVGEAGRTVVEMLADYQGYRSTQPEPRADTLDRDTGFQRLLQFDLDAELMAVNAHSPSLDAFDAWRYDEPAFRGTNARYGPEDDEFVARVDLRLRRDLQASAWALTGAVTSTEAVTVATEEPATFDLGLDPGDHWYAEVTDPTGRSARTPLRTVGVDDADPIDPVATSTRVRASALTQPVDASEDERIRLSATVEAADDSEPVGSVAFTSAERDLGSVEATDGTAEISLPADLPLGQHTVVAEFTPADAAAQAGSVSSAVTVEVVERSAPEPDAVATEVALSPGTAVQRFGAAPGQRVTLTARVGAADTSTAAGSVRFDVAGRAIGEVAVVDGIASLRVPSDLPVGSHAVQARFEPARAAEYAPSRSEVATLTVRKAEARLAGRLRPARVARTARARLVARATAPGVVPGGRLEVRIRGRGDMQIVAARLDAEGRAVVRLPRLASGRYRVIARYAGSSTVKAARAPVRTLRVR